MNLSRRDDCRICGGRHLDLVLALAPTPPANAFVARPEPQEKFPLDVHLCRDCGHVQLLDIVDPDLLFRDYVYVSGTSPVFVEHFRGYAEEIMRFKKMERGSKVLEFGSNDGTLLRFFKDAGMSVLGIDPARDIAARATASGIETIPEFFTRNLARKLGDERRDLIIGNNVFAHADDLHGILDAVTELLAEDGLFVFENSYLLDVYEKTLFDTIYHEHLSYHSVRPLEKLFAAHDLELIEAIRVSVHGGSIRGIVQRKGGTFTRGKSVDERIAEEETAGLYRPETYRSFSERIGARKEELSTILQERKNQGQRIVGFGAPAKATTLTYHFELGPVTLDYVIDDSPLKQGLLTPGHHIPVVASSRLYDTDKPDVAVILAWNFADSIIAKHQKFMDEGGTFIVPLPEVRIYETHVRSSV